VYAENNFFSKLRKRILPLRPTILIHFQKLFVGVQFPPKSLLKPFSTQLHAKIYFKNQLGKKTRMTSIVFRFDDGHEKKYFESINLSDGETIEKYYKINLNVRREVRGTLIIHHTPDKKIKKNFHAKTLY
jgi:hypothetical protein